MTGDGSRIEDEILTWERHGFEKVILVVIDGSL